MATPASAAKNACSPTRWLLVMTVSLVADITTAMPSASSMAEIISAVISAMPRSPSDWSLWLLVITHLCRSDVVIVREVQVARGHLELLRDPPVTRIVGRNVGRFGYYGDDQGVDVPARSQLPRRGFVYAVPRRVRYGFFD